MINVGLGVIFLLLMLYLASGAWSALGRRRRVLTERDFRKAERWRAESWGALPDNSRLLAALDIALHHDLGAGPACADEEHLPSGDHMA